MISLFKQVFAFHSPEENVSDIPTFVTHLECSETGKHYPADTLQGLSDTGKPLLVRYDLEALGKAVTKETLAARDPEFWRYREFLPIRKAENVVRLGDVMTPILPAPRLQSHLDCGEILIKDEGRLPTGSFKARGLALAVSMAKELGVTRMAMPTNGNAGAALAAYCSAAGIESYVFCPQDTPQVNVREIALQGAHTFLANGYINDCGRIVGEGKDAMDWFDTSTLKEPYRIEGKKTMGLELAEQLGWEVPDVIFYPTGGGTGLIGMWKAFAELEAIGWIGSKRPRMVAVQAEGCAPIVKAFEAVRESDGFAIAVSDEAINEAQSQVAKSDGILLCPEGAATLAAFKNSLDEGRISKADRCVLFNCATGLKYPMPEAGDFIDLNKPIDYEAIKNG
jgi:threonine synthase